MGKTGNATANNLHFAIYQNGYIDPLPYLMNEDPFNLYDCRVNDDDFTTFIKSLKAILGVTVDGTPDIELLNKTITISRKLNNNHPVVKVLQIYLKSLGYDLGSYGIDGR